MKNLNISNLITCAIILCGIFSLSVLTSHAQEPSADWIEGSSERLVIRNVTMIDGTGAPPQGPMDIAVEDGKITQIRNMGAPGIPVFSNRRLAQGTREIDGTGKYILPGFVSLHGHIHDSNSGQGVPYEYILKLWLAHGITSVRELGNEKGAKWTSDLASRIENGAEHGPRIYPYPVFRGWSAGEVDTGCKVFRCSGRNFMGGA